MKLLTRFGFLLLSIIFNIAHAAAPSVTAFNPIANLPVGTAFAGSFSVNDPAGGNVTKLRVHVSRTSGGSDCAIDVGSFSGTQPGGVKAFSGCAELSTQPGQYYLKVEAWNTTSEQAPAPNAVVQVGPVAVLGATHQAAAVAAGGDTVCALDAAGAVSCWGGFMGGDVENPVSVTGVGVAKGVAVGDGFACALEKSTLAKCWGSNSVGQLGNNTTTSSATPVSVIGLPSLAQISAGNNFACGLTYPISFGAGGAVHCWGFNGNGQLGGLLPTQSSIPIAVAGLSSGVGQIVTGAYHACALLTNGAVKCWGYHRAVDSTANDAGFSAPININLVSPIVSLGTSNSDTCGLSATGSFSCWGEGAGSLAGVVAGSNCAVNVNTGSASRYHYLRCSVEGTAPVSVATEEPFHIVGSGGDGHCVISTGGTAYCQGMNGSAQLGNGNIDLGLPGFYADVAKFQAVGGIRGERTVQLARGAYVACALTSVGKLYCWGKQGRLTTPSSHYVYVTSAFEVPAYRFATQTLATPSITNAVVSGSGVTLSVLDNLSASSPVVTTMQTKCRASGGTLAHGPVSTVMPSGRTPVLHFELAADGPWSCSVRTLGTADEGVWGADTGAQSPWSAEFAVVKQPTAKPFVQSATYDGAMATMVFTDNAPIADGPVIRKDWRCVSDSLSLTQPGSSYGNEPTASTHTLQFQLPPANDWRCGVSYATYGGNSPMWGSTAFEIQLQAQPLAGVPTITAGRLVGNTGVLTFADGQSAGGNIADALYACTRVRDAAVYSGVSSVGEASGGGHTISFPLNSTDYLQNPDSYSCTIRVRQGVLTSPTSVTFGIGPNRPPAVNGLAASVVNGVIQGQFVLSDPDGDSVKNMIVRFSDQPYGSLCSTGYLVPPETLVSTGARSFQVLTDSCSSLLASASTIYAWVEAYDQNGRQAAINSVSFANVPGDSLIPDPKTNSIVFSTIPNLKVDQAVDVSLRMVDGLGNTLTSFRGPVRITINESVSWSMSSDGSQTSAGFRYVAFRNGVGQIRALRFHGPGNITLHAASLTPGQQQTPLPNVQKSEFASLSALASPSGGVAVSGQSNQVTVTSSIGSGTSNYQIKLNVAPISSSDCSDLTAGRVGVYLVDTATTTRYLATLVPPCSGGAKLNVFVPKGHYRVAVFRSNVELRGWRSELSVVDKGTTIFLNQHDGPAWSIVADGKKPIVLVHGVFGSTVPWTSTGALGAAGSDGPAPQMPPTHCNDNSTTPQHTGCTNLVFYKGAGVVGFGWPDLRAKLESLGYYVVEAAYDWRLKPRDAAATLALRIKGAKDATKVNRVDVFAHSMGGLVALAYLEKMQNDGLLSDIDRLVLVGSPLAGSVNAFYLMVLGDPVEADKRVHNFFDGLFAGPKMNTYSNLARQIFEDMDPKQYLYEHTFATDTYTYSASMTREVRVQTLAKQVPSGWSLLPRTPSFANGSLSASTLNNLSATQTAIAGANPSLTNTECVTRSAAISRSTIPLTGDKTRVFYLVGTSESSLQGLDPTDFNKPNPTIRGDGTVPLTLGTGGTYGQLAEFEKINNIPNGGIVNCTVSGQFGPHPDMPGDASVQTLSLSMLALPPSASPPSGTLVASNDKALATAAAALPSLGFALRGPKVFALAGAFGAVGSDALGAVVDAAGSATYSQQTGSANALVSSPANGNYTMTLQPNQSIARVLVPITVSYSDGTNVASNRFAFLLGAGAQTLQFALASASASPITMVGRPLGVPKLSYTSAGGSGIVAWTAPSDVSIAGYQVYARRAMDSEWVQLGSTAASARSLAISISPASNDNPEYELAVLAVNAQGEGPVGAVTANRVTGDVALNFGDAVVVAPAATAVSAEVIAGNSVAQPFTVQGGEFSLNGGAWSTGGGVLNQGDRIKVRGVAPTTPGMSQAVTITTNTGVYTFEVLALSRRLSVGNTGVGTGTVSGGAISCGSVCSADYANGASVTLTASPAAGSIFAGWSGDCSGTGNCVLSMTAAKTVTATFGLAGPAVSLNPLSLTYANQSVGTTSAVQTVTLTNTGNAPLTISSIVRNNAVFNLTNNCASTLAAGANCTFGVSFTPASVINTISSVTVNSNAAGSPHAVILNGTGVPAGAPVCTLTANPNRVAANSTSVLTSSCANSPTSYSWTGGTCAGTTAATCTVTPATTTTYTVTATNAAGSGTASATVTIGVVDLTPILFLLLN